MLCDTTLPLWLAVIMVHPLLSDVIVIYLPLSFVCAPSLVFRLNCPKAAMRSLRLARQHASSDSERLVYEGWILYDTGHREEALRKAEESISLQRSFEAFFLKAYALADTSLDPASSAKVVELLEDALRCPSDGLRKGQVEKQKQLLQLPLLDSVGGKEGGRSLVQRKCVLHALVVPFTHARQLAVVCCVFVVVGVAFVGRRL